MVVGVALEEVFGAKIVHYQNLYFIPGFFVKITELYFGPVLLISMPLCACKNEIEHVVVSIFAAPLC